MRKFLTSLFLLLTVAAAGYGQSNTAAILPTMRSGTTLPLTCNPNGADIWFFKNAATVGVYRCSATNTWTLYTTGTGSSDATAANQLLGNASLASIKTDLDTLVTSGGGGYIRQDSTATMAKESGGNLAVLAGTVTAAKVGVSIDTITAAASGPSSAANSDAVVESYNALQKGTTAAMTATTSTQVIAAVASNYLYITACSFSNTHASVSTMMSLQDGSGGTTIWTGNVPFGGGNNMFWRVPLKVTTIGTGLFVVNATTGSNTFASCSGFSSTVSY